MLSGILGLFLFIIFPFKLINSVLTKAIKKSRTNKEADLDKNRKEEQRQREEKWQQKRIEGEKEIQRKHEKMIHKAIKVYQTFKKFNPNDMFILSDKPVFIRDGRAVFIAFPASAEGDTIHIFEDGYEKKLTEGKVPESFWYKDIRDCDDNYAHLVDNFEYALVSSVGGIMTSDESEIKYVWHIICRYLYEAIGVNEWVGTGNPF